MRTLKKGTAGWLLVLATLSWTLTPELVRATSPAQLLSQASLGIAETGRWLTAKAIDLGERLARRYDAAVTISYAAPRRSIAPASPSAYLLLAAPAARTAVSAYPTGGVTDPAVAPSDTDPRAATSTEDLLRAHVENSIDALGSALRQELLTLGRQATAGLFAALALSNRIDTLSRVSLVGATVAGVSGLTDADLPDDLTASNYLPLGGGVVSGGLILGSASSTDLYATLLRAGTGVITALSATSASVTDLVATSLTGSNASFTAATTANATSTSLAVTGTATTSRLVVSNAFSFQAVTGFLKATAGVVATALIELTTDVTGILPVGNGGTGWSAISGGAIPYGNGSSQLATTTAGTPGYVLAYLSGIPTWVASSTLATISGTLDVLKGGTGATSFGQGWIYSSGGTAALAASTSPTVSYIVATSTTASILPYASTTALSSSASAYLATNGGNVGVGTSSPAYKLSIDAGTAGYPLHISSNNQDSVIRFESSAAGGRIYHVGSTGSSSGAGNGFSVFDVTGAAARFLINPYGNIGIGTTTPNYLLTVGGNGTTAKNRIALWGDQVGSNGTAAGLSFFNSDGNPSTQKEIAGIDAGRFGDNYGGSLTLFTAATSTGATSTRMLIDSAGNVGIGTSNPGAKLQIMDNVTSLITGIKFTPYHTPSVVAGTQIQAADDNGNVRVISLNPSGGAVGIGTINPNQGALEVKNGSVCVDTNNDDNASSCIAAESDQRLKENIVSLSASTSLATLLKLNPVTFDWRVNDPEVRAHYPLISRFASSTQSIGLIAQEVLDIFPPAIMEETVGDDTVQYFQLDYEKFIPLLIKSVQEVASLGETFRATLIAWLAAVDNGITSISAREGKFAEQICIGATCVTENELRAVISKPVGVLPPDAMPPSVAATSTERELEPQIVD